MGNAQTIIQNLSPEERIVFMERHGLNDELIALYKSGLMTAEDIITYVQGPNNTMNGVKR